MSAIMLKDLIIAPCDGNQSIIEYKGQLFGNICCFETLKDKFHHANITEDGKLIIYTNVGAVIVEHICNILVHVKGSRIITEQDVIVSDKFGPSIVEIFGKKYIKNSSLLDLIRTRTVVARVCNEYLHLNEYVGGTLKGSYSEASLRQIRDAEKNYFIIKYCKLQSEITILNNETFKFILGSQNEIDMGKLTFDLDRLGALFDAATRINELNLHKYI